MGCAMPYSKVGVMSSDEEKSSKEPSLQWPQAASKRSGAALQPQGGACGSKKASCCSISVAGSALACIIAHVAPTSPPCVAQRPTPVNFISLLRFARRAEGLWQARNVFARARKAEGCTWHVYAAAAQIELNLTGAKGAANEDEGARVAAKIYAMAFERFEDDVGFVRHYLDFLQSQRDHGTMRAVLERVLQSAVGAGCRRSPLRVRLESPFEESPGTPCAPDGPALHAAILRNGCSA